MAVSRQRPRRHHPPWPQARLRRLGPRLLQPIQLRPPVALHLVRWPLPRQPRRLRLPLGSRPLCRKVLLPTHLLLGRGMPRRQPAALADRCRLRLPQRPRLSQLLSSPHCLLLKCLLLKPRRRQPSADGQPRPTGRRLMPRAVLETVAWPLLTPSGSPRHRSSPKTVVGQNGGLWHRAGGVVADRERCAASVCRSLP